MPADARLGLPSGLQRIMPGGGDVRDPGIVVFGEHSAIVGEVVAEQRVAFTVADLPTSGDDRKFKWRVGAYAAFDRHGWSWGPSTTIGVPAREDLLDGATDGPRRADRSAGGPGRHRAQVPVPGYV